MPSVKRESVLRASQQGRRVTRGARRGNAAVEDHRRRQGGYQDKLALAEGRIMIERAQIQRAGPDLDPSPSFPMPNLSAMGVLFTMAYAGQVYLNVTNLGEIAPAA
mmetsp:Transcript_15163/g.22609  ORF Transcript_15163/g.22609 Transcript_15163/m.22609 type:complete len:106 (-) Transcript_15163:141-458(-)